MQYERIVIDDAARLCPYPVMETTFTGKRNKRGDWTPEKNLGVAPVFVWPPKPAALFKYVFGYPGFLWPWNTIYFAVPIITWLWFTPDMAEMKTFAAPWIAYIFIRNIILISLVILLWQGWLHWKKAQGTDWKYTNKWFARDNPVFMFGNQTLDNLFWTFISAVPIWTAFEVVTMWLYANGYLPYVSAREHPIYFVLMLVLVTLMRETHFYLVHRLIHWGPLYKHVHYLHHNNVDPGPATGLAMHPLEHLLYFTGVIIHWIVPSHPIHAIFHLQHAAITPAQGHAGFERIVLADGVAIKTGDYFHYLHHKYFECNYGGDGPVNLDRAFGTFHDGSDDAQRKMNERFLQRAAQKAKAEGHA
jgi:sterol desaturase/sphingolipid hydroxylase (fatty acid hydroxylase superfamily)